MRLSELLPLYFKPQATAMIPLMIVTSMATISNDQLDRVRLAQTGRPLEPMNLGPGVTRSGRACRPRLCNHQQCPRLLGRRRDRHVCKDWDVSRANR